jgi:hypothetical protein
MHLNNIWKYINHVSEIKQFYFFPNLGFSFIVYFFINFQKKICK